MISRTSEIVPAPAEPRVHLAMAALAWSIVPLLFLATYGPSAGLGFISDDFGWIRESRCGAFSQCLALFGQNHGFYRPLVSVTFATDYALFGLHARGYGLTNLALAIACAALLFRLCRHLGLGRGGAAVGAAIWALNFHGINMAILWISGRTSLLLVAFSLAAAIALLRRSTVGILLFTALALLSKEEAVLLPVILVAMAAFTPAPSDRYSTRSLLAIALAVEVSAYLVLRQYAGAMTPSTAPIYYQFTFAPRAIGRNVLEYADRACTFAAAVALIGWVTLRHTEQAARPVRAPVMSVGLIWLVFGYAITVFLPVRSSLYACFPSVGAAICAAEFCGARWQFATPRGRRTATAVIVLFALGFAPVYAMRIRRWTELASFSHDVMARLGPEIRQRTDLTGSTYIVLQDTDRTRRVNLRSAFGTLIVDALQLETGRHLQVWVEPPLSAPPIAGMTPPCSTCPQLTYAASRDPGRRR